MNLKTLSLAFIGAVLAGISSGQIKANSNETIDAQDSKSAEFVAEMVKNGDLSVDPQTGLIRLENSVYQILMKYSDQNTQTLSWRETTEKKTGNKTYFRSTGHKCSVS